MQYPRIFPRTMLALFLWCPLTMVSVAMAQTPVAVTKVSTQLPPFELTFNGNIVATQAVDLASEVAGQVAQVHVEQGDKVVTGQLLVSLRAAPIEWQVKKAKAALKRDNAQVTLVELEQTRLQKLLATRAISQGDYDAVVARLQQAKADVLARQAEIAQLEDTLSRFRIVAPFDGIVATRVVERGGWLAVGETVLHLVSLQPLRLELAIPQQYYASLNDALSTARVRLASGGDIGESELPVERLVAYADATRSFRLWVDIDNQAGLWLPGMSTEALLHWQPRRRQQLMAVPADALVRRADGRTMIWTLDRADSERVSAKSLSVTVSHGSKNLLAISADGLTATTEVVVSGNESLQEGQWIQAVDDLAAASSGSR